MSKKTALIMIGPVAGALAGVFLPPVWGASIALVALCGLAIAMWVSGWRKARAK